MAKTLDYDFTDPQFDGTTGIEAQTGPDLTVTRASDATVMDYFNVLKTVNDNEPRFTGGRRVANESLQSQTLDDAEWISGNCSAVADVTVTDPDGGTSAYKLTEASDTAVVHSTRNALPTVRVGRTYTYSIYAKADERSEIEFDVAAGGFPNNQAQWFNLSTGTLGTTDGSDNTSGIEDAGDGWYRIWMSMTCDATSSSAIIYIQLGSGGETDTYNGDGTSGLHLYGAQLEDVSGQDDPSPSAYIATTTAAKAQWYATKRRTNLLSSSGEIAASTTTWLVPAPTTGTVTENVDGSITCESTGTGTRAYAYASYSTTPGKTYTFSANFTANSGGWTTGNIASTLPSKLTTMQNNGRASVTFTATGTFSTLRIGIGTLSGDNANAGGSVTISEAQLESGDTATAYIENTSDDYTPASSSFDTAITPTGLLIEEERTNLLTWTESFDNWTVQAGIVNAEDAIAPDGTLTADQAVDDTVTTQVRIRQAFTISSATDHTFSMYVKAEGLTWCALRTEGLDAGGNGYTYFDLSGGGATGTSDAAHTDAGVVDAGNGWVRCWVVCQSTTDVSGLFNVYGAAADGNLTVTADGTSSIFVWGAQIETGSFVTSYIPNDSATASVTRARDSVSATLPVGTVTSTGGTFYGKAGRPAGYGLGGTADPSVFGVFHSTPTTQLYFPNLNQTAGTFWMREISAGGVALSGTGASMPDPFQFAGAYGTDDNAKLYVEGVFEAADTSFGRMLGLDADPVLFLGCRTSNVDVYNGHIARIVYYDERLADSVLEDLSNGTFPVFQFPGTVAGDGGHIWPPRSNDPRWAQLITDSGITASGNFIDDVHAALEALGATTGDMDTLWKKVKAANSVTDTSEPYLY